MKWIIFFCMFSMYFTTYSQQADDSTAIIKVLEKESATWRSGDAKAHADCWKIQPYSIILVSTADGKSFSIPASMMNQASANMGHGGTFKNSNLKMSIHVDNAWVSHDEESTSPAGEKSYSHELRLLEKIDGAWKMVGQSIHLYKP